MGDARRACFAWAWIFFAVSVSISPFIALIFDRLYNFCPRTEIPAVKIAIFIGK
jgi:hypothetical protein